MSHVLHRPVTTALSVLAAVLVLGTILSPSAARADTSAAVRELVGLTPERVERFRLAMRDYFGGRATPEEIAELAFESRFTAPPSELDMGGEVVLGLDGRDLVYEEDFVLAGREDEFVRAAKASVRRRLGSSRPSGGSGRSAVRARAGWSHGPWIGVRAGHATARIGTDGWRLAVSRAFTTRSGAPWHARGWVAREDGDTRVAFTVGRSLLTSRHR